jgi:L-lactate dehydrogenase (cytochrome)
MPQLDRRLPSITSMERLAKRRIPKFAFDYLQGGIGAEACLVGNRKALDDVQLAPRYLATEPIRPVLDTNLFDREFPLPFAASPIGLSGLMWPRAVEHIAQATTRHGLALGLSSFATSSIEEISAIAGDLLWFQLYCTEKPEIENDLIDRANAAGCQVLIVTVDIPTTTRREKDIANGLSVPPKFDLMTLSQVALRPAWALATLRAGIPRFKTLLPYVPSGSTLGASAIFLKDMVEGHVTVQKLERIRERWRGQLIVKGILTAEEALLCQELGADAIAVSNHGGRQLDAAPLIPQILPSIRAAVGPDFPLIADGGVRSGLDIARFIACGANFVLIGRAFAYAVAAAGETGVDHAIFLLREELKQTMSQIGCQKLRSLADHRI